MFYLYLKLRVFLERKFQPKSVLKWIVSFIYSIDKFVTHLSPTRFYGLIRKSPHKKYLVYTKTNILNCHYLTIHIHKN